jgi:hypothetical protein
VNMKMRAVLIGLAIIMTACGGGGGSGTGTILGKPIDFDTTLSVVVSDFDGDGLDDIAAGRYHLTGEGGPFDSWIEILIQDRLNPGSYPTSSRRTVGGQVWAVMSGDLDGDANDDLVSANSVDDNISVVMNRPGSPGSFKSAVTFETGNSPDSVAIGDINGDGTADMAIGDIELSIFLQDSPNSGSYASQTLRASGATHVGNVALGDFNFDGRMDLAVITSNSNGMTDGIELWLQDPIVDAGFAPAASYAVSDQPTSLAVADINVDGFDDVVVAAQDASRLSVFLNDSGVPGTLSAPAIYGTCRPGEAVTVADVNNDALPDVIVSGQRNAEACVAVHLQSTAGIGTLQSADYYTGDGIVSGYSVATGDLNGDGLLDIAIADSGIGVFFQDSASPGVFRGQVRIIDD